MGEPVNVNYIDCQLDICDDSTILYSDDNQRKALGQVLNDKLIFDTVDRFVYWIDKFGDPTLQVEQRCKGEDLETLGLHLYNLLFDREPREHPDKPGTRESVRNCFEDTIRNFEARRANDKSLRLRLILKFHQAADKLATYPWEFLRVPWTPKAFFLAGRKTELILTRCVPEAGFQDKLDPEERPLKILIAYSAPPDPGLGKVGADEVISYIKGLEKENLVKVDTVYPSFKDIEAKLKAMKPHIFHFIGHGRVEGDEPQVALMREQKEIENAEALLEPAQRRAGVKVPQAAWTASATFAELFKEHQPRLVFLHACKGAATDYKFHSTALDLVKAKIPAVVAMQFEISNLDANTFATLFYQHIDAGLSVDEAVSMGRWELSVVPQGRVAWSDRGFGTPVIYLQSKGAVISPRPRETTAGNEPIIEAPIPTKVPCPYPDCPNGLVIPGRKFCGMCRRPVALCPTIGCSQVIVKNSNFCDACGDLAGAGSLDAGSAASATIADSKSQQPALQTPNESLPPRADSLEAKSSIDVRAELTQ